jgi:hypothetical protein
MFVGFNTEPEDAQCAAEFLAELNDARVVGLEVNETGSG